ncbi:MAG: TIGR03905 family TSCPD domain-containing protein [Lachnospiraceae bacterium]|nr:TIGR03905 family TSCPD domain-containing protein [Lachnospiraceae bacterium]
MTHTFTPKGVCATKITFELEEGKIRNLVFTGGCNGNLKAIAKLVEGEDAGKVAGILKGNDCGGRGTSCADQLSKALTEAKAAENV